MRSRIIVALAVLSVISYSKAIAQQTAKITSSGIGYLEYLPQDYNANTNDYPIVIFLHGIGERGTTSTDPATLLSSVQRVANAALPKYAQHGAQYPFILVSPQLKGSYSTWPADYVMDVLNHVRKYLRINERRIYITGLSLGGFGTWTTLGAYPQVFASAVAICSGGSALSKACDIAAEKIPLWAFHGTDDKVVSYTITTKMINAVNGCTPQPDPLAKTTLFAGDDHAIWDKVYQQTTAIDWMISFTKGTTSGGSTPTPTPTTNSLPVVNVGADKAVTLPANEVYIPGTASDADGSIASYKWTKIAGGPTGMTNTGGSRLRVYNLLEGSYTFRLTVTDDKGATAYDDVNVTVSAASTSNIVPVAYAGADKTTSATSITIDGSATDKDGTIVSYKWEKYAGGSVTLTNATSPNVTVSGMTDGKYYLRLLVTDDKGATDLDYMNITVSGSTTTVSNIAPVAHAGSDKVITSSSVTLYGSGTDKDGNIVSYKWEKYYGPAVTLTNANSPTVTLSGMKDGKYFLRLTVTDDHGATDLDYMNVIVSGSEIASVNDANIAPVAYAGTDKSTSSSTIRLYGSATDKDGTIVSYKWVKYYGPAVTLTNANTRTVTLSGMKDGKYFLRLTVKDNKGATDYDNMHVVVSGASARTYTPSQNDEDLASFRLIPEDGKAGSNNAYNIAIRDHKSLKKDMRSRGVDESGNEDFQMADES